MVTLEVYVDMINKMISIPVHEKTEVIIDQIVNYKHFCPDCGIVLHISKGFNFKDSFHTEKEFLFILSTFKNVFVNPIRLDTAFADIVHTHLSNFKYISSIVDFEYFCLNASNDLFVRKMPIIKDWDFNCPYVEARYTESWNEYIYRDEYLERILNYFGKNKSDIQKSQIEGSFYRKDLFQKMSDVINAFYNYEEILKIGREKRNVYPREEVYFPTVVHLLHGQTKNCNLCYTFVGWEDPYFRPTMPEIHQIAQGKMRGRYSVKRIGRNINDPVRFHISTFIGNYRDTSIDYIKIKCSKIFRNFFNLSAARRRIFIGHEGHEQMLKEVFKIKTMESFVPIKIKNDSIIMDEILSIMNNNRDALFVICTKLYPILLNIFVQNGFRENIDFIDGSLLLD